MVTTLPKEYYLLRQKKDVEIHLEVSAILARSAYFENDSELYQLSKWFKQRAEEIKNEKY